MHLAGPAFVNKTCSTICGAHICICCFQYCAVLSAQGFGVFSFVFESLFGPLVTAGYRVLALDFYGFGFSEAPLGVTYDADLFIQQAHELLAHLGLERPMILGGHSMGGLLAAVFAVSDALLYNLARTYSD